MGLMVWQPPQKESPAVCSTIISVNTQEAKTSAGTNTSTAAPIFILRGEMAGLQYTRYACVSGVVDARLLHMRPVAQTSDRGFYLLSRSAHKQACRPRRRNR
jgi:hypothetical protein